MHFRNFVELFDQESIIALKYEKTMSFFLNNFKLVIEDTGGRIFFATILKLWSFSLLLVWIPLEILYRTDSFMKYLSFIDSSSLVALMLFTYFFIAFIISTISLLLLLIFKLFHFSSAQKILLLFNCLLVVLSILYVILETAIIWSQRAFPLHLLFLKHMRYKMLISTFALLSIILLVPRLFVNLIIFSRKAFRFILAILIIACFIISYKFISNIYYNATTQGEYAIARTSPGGSHRLPNIVLLTFDALTSEDMSIYGYRLPTTSNIEKFARDCYVFDNMYANSTFTNPCIVSIETGKHPFTSKIYNMNSFLKGTKRKENIAHELRKLGYETIALFDNGYGHPNHNGTYNDFNQAPIIDLTHGLSASNITSAITLFLEKQGIPASTWFNESIYNIAYVYESIYFSCFPQKRHLRNRSVFRSPETTFALAEKALIMAHDNYSLFLWIHLFPPHAPYLPDNSYKYRFLEEKVFDTFDEQLIFNGEYATEDQPKIDKLRLRYDEYIAFADAEFGKFVRGLSKKGYLNDTIIFLTADHGEMFTKNYYGHGGGGLYQPLVHIPLLLHLPGQKIMKRIRSNAEQIDIAPTILDLLGLQIPTWLEGNSLIEKMQIDKESNKPIFLMDLQLCNTRGSLNDGCVAVIKNRLKFIYYIKSTKTELYDLERDPFEKANLAGNNKDIDYELYTILKEKFKLK